MARLIPLVAEEANARLGGEYSTCCRLLPLVDHDPGARELLDGDLRLAGAVGAHEADVLPGAEAARREEDLAAGRDGGDDVGAERLLARAGRARAQLLGHGRRPRGVGVPEEHLAAAGEERPRHRAPVDAAADHAGRPVAGRQGLRGQHGGRAGAERRDGAGVELGEQAPVGGVGEEDDAAHGRAGRAPGSAGTTSPT